MNKQRRILNKRKQRLMIPIVPYTKQDFEPLFRRIASGQHQQPTSGPDPGMSSKLYNKCLLPRQALATLGDGNINSMAREVVSEYFGQAFSNIALFGAEVTRNNLFAKQAVVLGMDHLPFYLLKPEVSLNDRLHYQADSLEALIALQVAAYGYEATKERHRSWLQAAAWQYLRSNPSLGTFGLLQGYCRQSFIKKTLVVVYKNVGQIDAYGYPLKQCQIRVPTEDYQAYWILATAQANRADRALDLAAEQALRSLNCQHLLKRLPPSDQEDTHAHRVLTFPLTDIPQLTGYSQ